MKEADKEQHLVDSDKEWCHLDFLGVPLLTDFPPQFPLCFITLCTILGTTLNTYFPMYFVSKKCTSSDFNLG